MVLSNFLLSVNYVSYKFQKKFVKGSLQYSDIYYHYLLYKRCQAQPSIVAIIVKIYSTPYKNIPLYSAMNTMDKLHQQPDCKVSSRFHLNFIYISSKLHVSFIKISSKFTLKSIIFTFLICLYKPLI